MSVYQQVSLSIHLLVLYAVFKEHVSLARNRRVPHKRNIDFVAVPSGLATVEMVRFELMTPCLPDKCSPSELHPRVNVCHCYRSDILGDDRHLYIYLKRNTKSRRFLKKSGSHLLSRAVSSKVPSAA